MRLHCTCCVFGRKLETRVHQGNFKKGTPTPALVCSRSSSLCRLFPSKAGARAHEAGFQRDGFLQTQRWKLLSALFTFFFDTRIHQIWCSLPAESDGSNLWLLVFWVEACRSIDLQYPSRLVTGKRTWGEERFSSACLGCLTVRDCTCRTLRFNDPGAWPCHALPTSRILSYLFVKMPNDAKVYVPTEDLSQVRSPATGFGF